MNPKESAEKYEEVWDYYWWPLVLLAIRASRTIALNVWLLFYIGQLAAEHVQDTAKRRESEKQVKNEEEL